LRTDIVDRTGQVALTLSDVSAPRLKRLMSRHPELREWPAFRHLYFLPGAKGDTIELTEEEFDALTSLLQLINAEKDLSDEVADFVLDAFVDKVKGHGGPDCLLHQVTDLAYEGQVGMLLGAMMGARWKMQVKGRGLPDHLFVVQFFESEKPTETAIECKNVHDHPDELRQLIISVARAIRKAAKQHRKRADDYHDLCIFIDLPIGVLSRPTTDYYKLIVNVFASLRRTEGFEWIDETQVIFTATGQTNMARHLLHGRPQDRNLVLLKPHVIGRTAANMSAARAFFLSFLFRPEGESPNIGNWSKYAVNIVDPESYLID
jgi:hypothetical protein